MNATKHRTRIRHAYLVADNAGPVAWIGRCQCGERTTAGTLIEVELWATAHARP